MIPVPNLDDRTHKEIVEEAKASHAELIVMGTHGRTGLGRVLLGSVAERVVAKATVPVMLEK